MKSKEINVLFLVAFLSMLFIPLATLSAQQREVSSREMSKLVEQVVQNSDRAYRLASQNYKAYEREIDSLLSRIETDLIAIERLTNRGEKLTSGQERQIQNVISNGVAIVRLREQAYR